ncbi:hypothetical protein ACIUTA_004970, partial [Escherichia coli]
GKQPEYRRPAERRSRAGTGQGFRHTFSPVNKKGPPAAHKNNTRSKAPADAFYAVLFCFAQ